MKNTLFTTHLDDNFIVLNKDDEELFCIQYNEKNIVLTALK